MSTLIYFIQLYAAQYRLRSKLRRNSAVAQKRRRRTVTYRISALWDYILTLAYTVFPNNV